MNESSLDAEDHTSGTANIDASLEEGGAYRLAGAWNSFQFDPPLKDEDAFELDEHARKLGYRMYFQPGDYSIERIQKQLLERGPSSFLNVVRLREDISAKEPPATAEQRMATRFQRLAPESELLITDPYLFTSGRKGDSEEYAASVMNMISPALSTGIRLTAIVSHAGNHPTVREAVLAQLETLGLDLDVTVIQAEHFHDRFWIADRSRGLIVGASLNKIGSRIFFVDELNEEDVAAVLAEVDAIE